MQRFSMDAGVKLAEKNVPQQLQALQKIYLRHYLW